TAGAGTRLAELQAFLAGHRQFIPWDPPDADRATIGGLFSAGEAGPLVQGYPHPRHLVLGLWAALADGSVIHPGAKVVKNVAGFDLSKLFWQARGTLGTVARMTIRTYAISEAERMLSGVFGEAGPAFALAGSIRDAFSLSRLEIVLSCGGGAPGHWGVWASIAGDASVVEAQSVRAKEAFRAANAAVRELSAAERMSGVEGLPGTAAFRGDARAAARARAFASTRGIRAILSAIPAAAERGVRIRAVASPFAGTVRLAADGEPPAVESALAELRAIAQRAGGFLLLDRIPAGAAMPWRGADPSGLSLMRRLKAAFDPSGALAPGWEP
ncbi:MAG: FAD-binding oxidoreductase, partial [Planctomycetota bacterium]